MLSNAFFCFLGLLFAVNGGEGSVLFKQGYILCN